MISLQGEIALVTGASRGIGETIALTLARCGATVVGTATTEAGAQSIAQKLRDQGALGDGMRLEVTDPASIEAVLKRMTQAFGAPSILVNNAAVTRDNLLLRMKEEDWSTVIETDLTAIYRLSKGVLRAMMKAQRGRIINITSVVGLMGNAGQANYAAAKAGVLGFTKSLAREVGSRKITVNAIAPGAIETEMTQVLSEAQRQAIAGTIPLQRWGLPQDVAHAVAFLASPWADYITGETLSVNGGMFMS